MWQVSIAILLGFLVLSFNYVWVNRHQFTPQGGGIVIVNKWTGRTCVLGATAARDGGQFGAGWSVSRSDVSFFFYYDGNANADLVAHGLTAGILLRW